jgi:hypothetical protein
LANAALDSVVKYDFNPSELAVIRPTSGGFNTADGQERFLYYPETYLLDAGWGHWEPTLWIDGLEERTDTWGHMDSIRHIYRDMITTRRAVSSPLSVDFQVEYEVASDTGMVHVEVLATDTVASTRLQLRLAIIESNLSYAGSNYGQVLRDYFPTPKGVSFTIAPGDTFTHSQAFVIQTGWDAENYHIVVFVQNDGDREVIQTLQGPVVAPVPEQVADVKVSLAGHDLLLEWTPVTVDTDGNPLVVAGYHVYRDTTPSFTLGSGPPLVSIADTFYVDHSGVVGDAGMQYFYSVTAFTGGKESDFPGAVGEFDKDLF